MVQQIKCYFGCNQLIVNAQKQNKNKKHQKTLLDENWWDLETDQSSCKELDLLRSKTTQLWSARQERSADGWCGRQTEGLPNTSGLESPETVNATLQGDKDFAEMGKLSWIIQVGSS